MNAILLTWIFLQVAMSVNGEDKMNSMETSLFAASIVCQPHYKVTEHVTCTFNLKNNDIRAYSVLTSTTPLREQSPLGLEVTRDGQKVEFAGVVEKRGSPIPQDFLFIDKGKTVSKTIDLSSGYDTTIAGMYTVVVSTYLQYVQGSVQTQIGNTQLVHLTSLPAKFQVAGF